MSAPKKVSDAAFLGAIRARTKSVRVGPSFRRLAEDLGLSYNTVKARAHALVAAGVIEFGETGVVVPLASQKADDATAN